ncbi:MAG: hypothetical protein P9X24_16860 [Candidatus Hatepunaea meridiana]|nr:hypothetical protein [Candidatus Hatepunaea meridiana]
MIKELSLLIRLQDIDTRLLEINAEKGDLPEIIQKLQEKIAQNKKEITNTVEGINKIEEQNLEQKKIIETAQDQMKKSQGQIFNVKTTREYDAISSEIEQSKHRISESESHLLEFMAQEDDLRIMLSELEKRKSVYNADIEDRQFEMKERSDFTQEEELNLQQEREKIITQQKSPVYSHYERIRAIRDGIGVTQVSDSACGYCYSRIPPQRLVEIKRMNDIILCEVCGCILVINQK